MATPADHWTETLSDGTRVVIRPITADDLEAERSFIDRLSPGSRAARFLGGAHHLSEAELRRLCEVDRDHDMAFVALAETGPGITEQIGVSRYAADEAADHAEVAVVVADAWQHRGLGSLLLMHLVDYAKSHGFNELHSIDLPNNEPMRQLAREFGFVESPDERNPGQVRYTLDLAKSF